MNMCRESIWPLVKLVKRVRALDNQCIVVRLFGNAADQGRVLILQTFRRRVKQSKMG